MTAAIAPILRPILHGLQLVLLGLGACAFWLIDQALTSLGDA